ncbi:MAG TPA: IPT/TIG domain-containing protein [Candidatus Aquilonibacter sp.]|nr:IPT/TIG domain-containing protein [Candidatus Aquilonibacter sp.]
MLPVISCSCPSTPSLTSISPSSATAGGVGFVLTINGSNFNSNSVVTWNGASQTMSFVSSKQLTVTIPATDIAQPETVFVYVYNPSGANNTVTEGTTSATDTNTCNVASSKPVPFTVSP